LWAGAGGAGDPRAEDPLGGLRAEEGDLDEVWAVPVVGNDLSFGGRKAGLSLDEYVLSDRLEGAHEANEQTWCKPIA
jgi:hypothetical protein